MNLWERLVTNMLSLFDLSKLRNSGLDGLVSVADVIEELSESNPILRGYFDGILSDLTDVVDQHEELVEAAHEDGYDEGHSDAQFDGDIREDNAYENGYDTGKSEGYNEGHSEGYDEGYDEGYEAGREDGEM